MKFERLFTRIANHVARAAGLPLTFVLCCAIIVAWAVTGPIFNFSDTWQLIINTGTTIITFLMVFLIQNTQNRDGSGLQIKLDEIIRSLEGAHNAVLDLEELPEDQLAKFREQYEQLARDARQEQREGGGGDTGTPEVGTG